MSKKKETRCKKIVDGERCNNEKMPLRGLCRMHYGQRVRELKGMARRSKVEKTEFTKAITDIPFTPNQNPVPPYFPAFYTGARQ
jgi:hypothetical protein